MNASYPSGLEPAAPHARGGTQLQPQTALAKSNRNRILHIITGLGTGGAEMMLYKLLSKLDRSRFDPIVVSLTETGPVGAMIEELGIPVLELRFKPGSMNPIYLLRLIVRVRKLAPDVIQTWLYKADLLGGVAGWFAGRIPVVWGIRNSVLDYRHLPRSTILAQKLCVLTSGILPARIVSCSHMGAEVHVDLGYAAGKIDVIPNGFNLDEFKPDPSGALSARKELGVTGDSPLILHVGRVEPLKDYPTLIEAAGILKAQGHAFTLALCGLNIDGGNTELTRWIREQDVEDRVRLLGPRKDVRRVMQGADLYVSSSKGEGFPNVIGEAMASGLPCAVTDAGDSARMVAETGRVAPILNPQALSEAMASLLLLPTKERQALGQAARRRVGTHYELGGVVRRFEELYLNLISQSGSDS